MIELHVLESSYICRFSLVWFVLLVELHFDPCLMCIYKSIFTKNDNLIITFGAKLLWVIEQE